MLFERHDNVFTVCEMKYGTKPVGPEIIPYIEQKIKLLPLTNRHSIEKVLITATPPTPALRDMHYFNRVISIEEFFRV